MKPVPPGSRGQRRVRTHVPALLLSARHSSSKVKTLRIKGRHTVGAQEGYWAKATEETASVPFFSCKVKKKKKKAEKSSQQKEEGLRCSGEVGRREAGRNAGVAGERAGRPLGSARGAWLTVGAHSNALNE